MPHLQNDRSTGAVAPVIRPDVAPPARVRRALPPHPPALNKTSAPIPEAVDAPTASRASSADDYEIGYKRPPQHSRFKKGQSGNPKGRPKGARGVNAVLKEIMDEKIAVKTGAGRQKMRRKVAMLHRAADLALAGNTRMMEMLLRRLDSAESLDQVRVITAEASSAATPVDLDAHDQAILAAFRATLTGEPGSVS